MKPIETETRIEYIHDPKDLEEIKRLKEVILTLQKGFAEEIQNMGPTPVDAVDNTAEAILSRITGESGIYLTHGMVRGSEALEAMEIYKNQK